MKIDPVLYDGAPLLPRSAGEDAVYRLLASLGIPFARADHQQGDTMEQLRDVERFIGCPIPKNLLLTTRNRAQVFLLTMPGDKPLRTRFLSQQIPSSRLSFAPEDMMLSLLGVGSGSLTPLALMNDASLRVRFLVDREVLAWPYLGVHPLRNSSTLRIASGDLFGTFLSAVGHRAEAVDLPDGGGPQAASTLN